MVTALHCLAVATKPFSPGAFLHRKVHPPEDEVVLVLLDQQQQVFSLRSTVWCIGRADADQRWSFPWS